MSARPVDDILTIVESPLVINLYSEIDHHLGTSTTASSACRFVSWVLPPRDWWKLNVDSSVFGASGDAGVEGLIRDHAGKWIMSFSVMAAELGALQSDLEQALSIGCAHLEVESDSLETTQFISSSPAGYHPRSHLISDARLLLSGIPQFRVLHTLHEGNRCADFLYSKLALDQTWASPLADLGGCSSS
ncbi:putative ribonuclease H protein At1g65750 [Populus alba]|uniref:putative ribonuclease H protein At1g65750 n=1 Tax=Populus alba TaxID=43335 RepID=UPI00158920C7|nr:uncharacterized protein LOC118052402 [Populus alba]